LFITNSLISQQIKEVKFQSNAGEYALYLEGSSSPNCYIGGGNKIVGIGNDFVLVEYNNIYFTKDCNCKTIASKEAANIQVISVSGKLIKTNQLNGVYSYNKYWKTEY
jgi:hypothetical protein